MCCSRNWLFAKNVRGISGCSLAAWKSFSAVFRAQESICGNFNFLLSWVNHRLKKQATNYRQPVSYAERLVVNIRYDFKGIFSSLKPTDRIRGLPTFLYDGYWGSFYSLHKNDPQSCILIFMLFCIVKILYICHIFGLFHMLYFILVHRFRECNYVSLIVIDECIFIYIQFLLTASCMCIYFTL